MEDEETTISSSNGWWSNRNYFQLHQGRSWYKEIWNSSIKYELNCQWYHPNTDDRYSVCITVEYLPKIEQRTIIVSWNVVLSSAEYFRYNPHFLLQFTSGLWACSILVTALDLLAACRYMALKQNNLPCRPVKVSNCTKILLNWHACYDVLAVIKHSTCWSL